MAYNILLADRIREFLFKHTDLKVEEKKMFRGMTFMVNGKMCVGVSNDNLMCRFDPDLQAEVAERNGYQPMIMKGKEFKGYCYVSEFGYTSKKDLEFWVQLCLSFNDKAKRTKKKK